ncbi:MAG: hypothetical protein KGL29_14390 [Alphaproteobacteria bacterium]|nr:hypothetical protein [Alphaproteobacteria bacterium]
MGSTKVKSCVLGAVTALLFTPAFSHAGPRDDMLEALGKCADMPGAEARHLCFDQLVPRLKAMASAPAPPDQPVVREDNGSWFGLDVQGIFSSPRDDDQTADQGRISAAVTRYWIDSQGYFVVSLGNGQVWGQLDGDDSFAHFRKSGENTVVISRGFLGSYNLQLNGLGENYKVKRIK